MLGELLWALRVCYLGLPQQKWIHWKYILVHRFPSSFTGKVSIQWQYFSWVFWGPFCFVLSFISSFLGSFLIHIIDFFYLNP